MRNTLSEAIVVGRRERREERKARGCSVRSCYGNDEEEGIKKK